MMFLRVSFFQKIFLLIGFGVSLLFFDLVLNNKGLLKRAENIKIPLVRDYYDVEDINLHRQVAQQLLQIEKELVRGNKMEVMQIIEEVVKILDKRYVFSKFANEVNETRNSRKRDNIFILNKKESEEVVTEGRNDETFPDFKRTPELVISSTDFHSLVTVFINFCERNSKKDTLRENNFREIIRIMNKLGFRKAFIAVDKKNEDLIEELTLQNIEIIEVLCSSWNDDPLGALLPFATTKFVLYFSSRMAVTETFNIKKLINIFYRIKEVGVIGIEDESLRNESLFSCLQLFLDRDNLQLFKGFDYIGDDCYFCDVVSTSFLASTNILKDIKPDYSLPHPLRQIDWAIQLQRNNVMSLFCPNKSSQKKWKVREKETLCEETKDGLLNNSDYENLRIKHMYSKLAKKYEVSYLKFPNGTALTFNCKEIEFQCRMRSRVRQFLLPKCCLQLKNAVMEKFISRLEYLLISHKLEAGSNLGAVKFKNHIPWDFDDDVTFESLDEANFLKWRLRISNIKDFTLNSSSFANSGELVTYFKVKLEEGFRFDTWGKNYPFLTNKNDLPDNVPCLLFGYYPVLAANFLRDPNKLTTMTLKEKRNLTYIPRRKTLSSPNATTEVATYLELDTKCFLHSFARIGSLWVSGPLNPGKFALERYGGNILKHEVHWRFKKSDYMWPKCLISSHPLCLDIHPMDGSLPFL